MLPPRRLAPATLNQRVHGSSPCTPTNHLPDSVNVFQVGAAAGWRHPPFRFQRGSKSRSSDVLASKCAGQVCNRKGVGRFVGLVLGLGQGAPPPPNGQAPTPGYPVREGPLLKHRLGKIQSVSARLPQSTIKPSHHGMAARCDNGTLRWC